MKNFTYKCVHVPNVLNTGKVKKNSHLEAISTYEKIINEAAEGGWELVNIDTITSVQNPGCLGGLLGSQGETITFKLLVFKKEI